MYIYIFFVQFSFPKWARTICQLRPEDRTPEQLQNLASVMRQLKDFRKYSKKMQLLLAKITRYRVFVFYSILFLSFYNQFQLQIEYHITMTFVLNRSIFLDPFSKT